MKIAARRRLAVGAVATAGAMVAGLVVTATPASAAVIEVLPRFTSNTETRSLEIRTSDIPPGNLAVFTGPINPAVPNQVASFDADATTDPAATALNQGRQVYDTEAINFATVDGGDPADPGAYQVRIDASGGDPRVSTTTSSDCLESCFNVVVPDPTVTSLSPRSQAQSETSTVVINGTNFARSTRIEFLIPQPFAEGVVDDGISVTDARNLLGRIRGTSTRLTKTVAVAPDAPTGVRDVRVTNTDGKSSICAGCFEVLGAALVRVDPAAQTNDRTQRITVFARDGAAIPANAVVGLRFARPQATNADAVEDIIGTDPVVAADGSSATATVDLRSAAPGDSTYIPITVTDRSDGTTTTSACISTCRFSLLQQAAPAPTAVEPSTQPAGTTQRVTIRGSGFAQGSAVRVERATGLTPLTPGAEDVTVTDVVFVSATELQATFRTASTARVESRSVTVTNTDTQSGTCSPDCFAITAAAASPSPSPSATSTATTSPSPSPSESTAGGTRSRYSGLASPVRVLDTRDNRGSRRRGPITLDLSRQITDPNATAAVLNVTVTNGSRRGFLVAYPADNTRPGTSNVNFEGQRAATRTSPATAGTQANEVVVRLSRERRVTLFVDSAEAHVIADLVGSFTTSTGGDTGRVTSNAPVRALDTRNTGTRRRSGEVVLDLTGRIPEGATSAVLNVTVTETTRRGFVTVFPTGTSRPRTSNVNFERGQTQANEVLTRVGTGSNAGRVSLTIDSANAALVVDVVGAVVPGATEGQVFTALAQPERAIDTRLNNGRQRRGNVVVQMPTSVPDNATGVILNVTATNGTKAGFVTVFPAGQRNPGTSNVNFPTNLTQANEVLSGLGDNRSVTLFVGGGGDPAAHVIVDVVGYLTRS